MRAGKLARVSVKASHALDGQKERLVGGQTSGTQAGKQLAQSALEFFQIRITDSRAPPQPSSPMRDPRFQGIAARQDATSPVHWTTAAIR